MSILGWLILGALAGFIASKLVENRGQGLLVNVLLGIVGAEVGGFLFSAVGGVPPTGFNIYSLVVSVVGAAVVLWIFRMVSGRRRY